jgi:predicted metal-dependent peptidase
MEHIEALSKAKIALMSTPDTAFFTTVCFNLMHVWDDSIPTACVDGKNIRFNTKFFMGLSPSERLFLLLHETLHVVFMHMCRIGDRNHAKWNVAGDHVINLLLIERGFKMPKDGLADPIYIGLSTDEVYKLLPEQNPSKVDMDIEMGNGDPDLDEEALAEGIQDILIQAAIQSKMQDDKPGTIPGEIQIFLDKLLAPKLPWHRILQKYLQAFSKSDYSFKKPNRRFFPQYYLPSMYSTSLIDIGIAVDTSGSVSDHDFNVFVSEVAGIFKMMKPDKISLIQFDTEIKSVTSVRSIKELSKINFLGRGGTDIRDLMKWAEANKPQVLLIFSDGGFHAYPVDHKVPIVWLIHNNTKFLADYGKVIHYNI